MSPSLALGHSAMSFVADVAAYGALLWSLGIFVVQGIGITNLFRFYSSRPRPAVVPMLPSDQVPHITIIRPVKGLEPKLYECIVSTFQQAYPPEKLSIRLCVSEKSDPAYPILVKAVRDFPGLDAEVLVEEEDPLLHGADGHVGNLGPNPKIRNISRAYREAKGDIIWIIDCNVWVGTGVAGRMVDRLLGLGPNGSTLKPFKFVHQLPLLTDLTDLEPSAALPNGSSRLSDNHPKAAKSRSGISRLLDFGGGRLDEMFMATTHAKFYSAINIVGVAPCIVGKSNMFRKSHLDRLTDPAQNPALIKRRDLPVGIGHFSWNICEDHLIGDLLWRSNLPGYGNHGLVLGDLAVQPMEDMSVRAYFARRARWLRARKWTVVVATMVEPGVESLLCNMYFAYGATTAPWVHDHLGVPQTWAAMALIWLAGVMVWMTADWFTYCRLHAGRSVEVDEATPAFARGTEHVGGPPRRSFAEWLPAWMAREVLALPIWTWAVLLGTTVSWRGRTFHVRTDMTVYEIGSAAKPGLDKADEKRE